MTKQKNIMEKLLAGITKEKRILNIGLHPETGFAPVEPCFEVQQAI